MPRRVRKVETCFGRGGVGRVRLGLGLFDKFVVGKLVGELVWMANLIWQTCIGRTGIGELAFGGRP